MEEIKANGGVATATAGTASSINEDALEADPITKLKMKSQTTNELVKGVMVESYIEDGNQPVGGGCYGKSITDPCLGWEKTERLLKEVADLL